MSYQLQIDENKASVLYLALTQLSERCQNELIIAEALVESESNKLPTDFKDEDELMEHVKTQSFILEQCESLSEEISQILQEETKPISKPKWKAK